MFYNNIRPNPILTSAAVCLSTMCAVHERGMADDCIVVMTNTCIFILSGRKTNLKVKK